jgi:hypothetical protein
MIQRDPNISVRGPIMQGHSFVEKFGQYMTSLSFECPHGTRLDSLFGYFVDVQPFNTNKSRCTIYFTEEVDGSGDPLFKVRQNFLENINEFICNARVDQEIVNKDAVAITGATVWESKITYFDEVHNERETTYIISQETLTTSEWDAQLNESHEVTVALTSTKPTVLGLVLIPGVDPDPDVYVFRSYEKVKCGWYTVSEEVMSDGVTAPGFTFVSNENYHWPAVLIGGLSFGILNAEDDDEVEYIAGVLIDYKLKEAFSGACKVSVVVGWSTTAASGDGVQQLIPDSVSYQGLFMNFTIPECLHDELDYTETMGTHPVLTAPLTRDLFFSATKVATIGSASATQIDWPTSLLGSVVSNPYKGGYITTSKTYYAPSV